MSKSVPILTAEQLVRFKKKIPTQPGWYYIACYNPEAKWYYEYHALLDDQAGTLVWYLGGTDEMIMRELKAIERGHRMYLIGDLIPFSFQQSKDVRCDSNSRVKPASTRVRKTSSVG